MSLKFSLMVTSVALAAILAGAWLADVYREHDSRAVLLPDQVITLFPDPKPLTAFALTDDKNRVFDLASLKGKWSFLFLASPTARKSGRKTRPCWPPPGKNFPRNRTEPEISKSLFV